MGLSRRGSTWGPSLWRRALWAPLASQTTASLSVGNIQPGWNPLPSGHSPSSPGQTHGLGTRSPRTSVLEVPALTQTLPGFSKWHEAGTAACSTHWLEVPC